MDFVLIPGAWMGAWVWEPVARGLRELGHGVRPVTLSALADEDADVSDVGLATHVDDVVSILERDDLRRAAVVGHSYSGMVAGQVGGWSDSLRSTRVRHSRIARQRTCYRQRRYAALPTPVGRPSGW